MQYPVLSFHSIAHILYIQCILYCTILLAHTIVSTGRREAGHDFCIIKLSERAQICAVELDTAHFTGNNVMHTSLQIADLSPCQETTFVSNMPGVLERLLNKGLGVQGTGHTPEEVLQAEQASTNVQWTELLAYSPLQPGYEESRMHYFTLPSPKVGTHVRVNYYPDGGVARLRLYSSLTTTVLRTPTTIEKPLYAPISTGKTCTVVAHSSTDSPPSRDGTYPYPELSGADNGGIGLACSNKHYGEPSQLLQSSLGKDMGDGWETARHPERPSILVRDPKTNLVASPLKDWSIIKLGSIASSGITRIIVDTRHFRGNYPESVTCEGCFAERGITDEMVMSGTSSVLVEWFPLILRTRMSPDSEHIFDSNIDQIVNASRAVTHVRVSIYPDGGLSRVRIYGESNDKDHHDGDMPCKL